eukprot:SAG11_NODE_18193_length_497_cov_1.711055_1_plen_71_part_01
MPYSTPWEGVYGRTRFVLVIPMYEGTSGTSFPIRLATWFFGLWHSPREEEKADAHQCHGCFDHTGLHVVTR